MARTDPGLGPKAASDAEQSGARPAPKAPEPSVQIAEPPRTGGVDTVDAILEGFGDRPDRPRVRVERRAELTPVPSLDPPQVAQKNVSTAPGQRQRSRREMMYLAMTGLVLLGVIGFVFWITRDRAAVAPAVTVPAPREPAAVTAPAANAVAPLPTVEATALPTTEPPVAAPGPAARTTTPKTTAKPAAAPPSASAAATAEPTPKATGSAPPGFNLLPKDRGSLE
jgi:hypothetical protein